MRPMVTLRDALSDPQLLGGAIPGESWLAWRVLLIASMGEPLHDDERFIFTELTGRDVEPLERVDELWAIVGRRGGKTRAAGTLGAYLACLVDYSDVLAKGERGVLPVLAASTTQAERAFQHIAGVIEHSPILTSEIESRTTEVLRLKTGIDIEVRPANFRTIRSITAVAAVADEVAFWQVDGAANPDAEILNAVRPALATTGGPLISISSPYAKRGEVWGAFKRDYGQSGDPRVLVAKGASRSFNPTLRQDVVDRAIRRDPAAAASEYLGEFRGDIEALLTEEAVEAVISPRETERAPVPSLRYVAFCDPSGGSADSMTLAIGHRDQSGKGILDAVRERRPPFSPEDVVAEFAALLKGYRITSVRGDRYGGEWPVEVFRKAGVTYQHAGRSKSEIYRDAVPLINGRQVDLLDLPRLKAQLVGLERRTARGGRDSIDHAPGAHDDIANSVMGVLVDMMEHRKTYGMMEVL